MPLLVIVGLMLSLVFRGGATANFSHPNHQVLSYASSMEINKLLADTNAQRVSQGLAPLKLSRSLDSAAEAKAQDMATRDYWSHTEPGNKAPWIFVAAQNYHYQLLGENLAAGFGNEQSTVNAWMASTEHRANILNPKVTQAGFGVAQSPDYRAAGGGPMTIVVAYYALPAPSVEYAIAHPPKLDLPAPDSASATTHAQIALAGFTWAALGTALAIVVILLSVGTIISRHALAFRRAAARGERFVAKHPLVDLMLIAIIFLAYLLTQSAGFIK